MATQQRRQRGGHNNEQRAKGGQTALSRRGLEKAESRADRGHAAIRGIRYRHEEHHNGSKDGYEERLARALGWFSIGLGLVEVTAPRNLAQFIGVGDHRITPRMLGLREIASGIGILTQRRPAEWMWSRVGGDVMDLACLAAASTSSSASLGRVAAASAAVAGVTVLDFLCSQQLSRRSGSTSPSGEIRVSKSITVNASPEELYRFWHDFENLPCFMNHLKSVQVTGDTQSHWVVKAPAGATVEWDAEITDDHPNELIAWRSIGDADVDHSGNVRFERASGGRGTVLRVALAYAPPAGMIGTAIAKLFGEAPDQQIDDDLRRFKQIMETGEVPTTVGQSRGTGRG